MKSPNATHNGATQISDIFARACQSLRQVGSVGCYRENLILSWYKEIMVRMHSMKHKSNCRKTKYATRNACAQNDATGMAMCTHTDCCSCWEDNRGVHLSYRVLYYNTVPYWSLEDTLLRHAIGTLQITVPTVHSNKHPHVLQQTMHCTKWHMIGGMGYVPVDGHEHLWRWLFM